MARGKPSNEEADNGSISEEDTDQALTPNGEATEGNKHLVNDAFVSHAPHYKYVESTDFAVASCSNIQPAEPHKVNNYSRAAKSHPLVEIMDLLEENNPGYTDTDQSIYNQIRKLAQDGILSSLLRNKDIKGIEELRPHASGSKLDVPLATLYNTRALPKDADSYRLEKFEKNAMLIINQIEIKGYKNPRHGSRKDGRDLSTTFEKFGFKVEEEFNLDKASVENKLKEFSEKDFTDYGCLAVVVLTHGSDMGRLKTSDNKVIYEAEIIQYFNNRNPTLVTKPILFIIQACRGTKMSEAILAGRVSEMTKDADEEEIVPYTVPAESDMLVLHSSYVGKLAIRHELEGTWFIQTLCKKINAMASTHHLEEIMLAVKREVAIDKNFEEYNRSTDSYEINKQMPTVTSTLIRKLYLRKFAADTNHADGEVSNIFTQSSMQQFSPCACYLDVFLYLKSCIRYYVEENQDDYEAKSFLDVAESFSDGEEFHQAKLNMARVIRNHLMKAAKDEGYYKFLYLFMDPAVEE